MNKVSVAIIAGIIVVSAGSFLFSLSNESYIPKQSDDALSSESDTNQMDSQFANSAAEEQEQSNTGAGFHNLKLEIISPEGSNPNVAQSSTFRARLTGNYYYTDNTMYCSWSFYTGDSIQEVPFDSISIPEKLTQSEQDVCMFTLDRINPTASFRAVLVVTVADSSGAIIDSAATEKNYFAQ